MNDFRRHRRRADYGKSRIPWGPDFRKPDLLCQERTAKLQKKKIVWMESWNYKQTENIEMNRWREKNKDENFRNNSNVNTAFKNTHKHKSQEVTVIKERTGRGINSGRNRAEMGDWYKITCWSGKAVRLTHKNQPGAETRHSRLATLPTPEPVTSSLAEAAYSNTGSGRNNCNVPWENIRLAEESKRCLFMCGRENPSRRCSRLISCRLAKLGTTFAFTERSRARRGCRKICTHTPPALENAVHPERKAICWWEQLRSCFVLNQGWAGEVA